MTQKRKAELQRKLSIAPVPKPPDDLADRIKAGIPDLRSTMNDRERFTRSTSMSLRVAASIILLISSAYLAVQLVSTRKVAESAIEQPAVVTVSMQDQVQEKDALKPQATQAAPAEIAKLQSNAVARTLSDERKKEREVAAQTVRPAAPARVATLETRSEPREENEGVVGGAVGGVVGGVRAEPPPAAVMAPPPPPPPASAPAPAYANTRPALPRDAVMSKTARADAPSAAAGAITVTSNAPAIVSEAHAADFSLAAPASVFGVSIKPQEFDRLRKLIESQQQPEAASVDVAALVNHFAGARSVSRGVGLQVETSQAPLATGEAYLRITIDTPPVDGAGSRAPVAKDATLEIDVTSPAVEKFGIVGGGNLTTNEAVLVKGTSVTRLVMMKLKPGTKPNEIVAKVRLSYRSVQTDKVEKIERDVRANHLWRDWTAASRRHRVATLGAVWGESLKGAAAEGERLAETAKKLSNEQPSDEKARDLATAAEATSTSSSRPRNSGPTGSER